MVENINPNSETFRKEEEKKNANSFSLSDNIEKKNTKKNKKLSNIRASLDKGKNLGTFILGQKLGEGTFGVVRMATHIITGEKVAVKILDKQKILKESDLSRLEKEIRILKMLHHNNIVHLYNVIQTSSTIYLVMEYIDGKELFEYIIHKKRLSELEACKFYQQLISGIEYLGKLKIAHRDLKPENLLLDKKKNIKLVDFGLSNIYKNNELLSTACGSPSYAAPEMLSGNKYNGLNVDIWSSGIVLYAMICGKLPFEDKDNTILYKKIKQGIFKIPEFISDNAKDFLHRILNVDPEKRYNIEQIKIHPWFNIINPKIYMSQGLLLNIYIIPIDEDIIDKMVNEYEYNGIEVMINLLANKHNHLTTTYYLLLGKKIRKGGKSVCNTCSSEFLKYINNPGNLLSNYKGNWKKLFKDRTRDKYSKIQDNVNEIKIKEDIKETKQKIESLANQNNNNKDFYVNKYEDINIKKNINESSKQNNNNNNNQDNNNTSNTNDETKAKDNIININIDNNNNNENIKNIIEEKKNIEQKKKPASIFEYLKKLKEFGHKNNNKEENRYSNSIEQKSPKTRKSDTLLQIEKKNKKYKEYENKLKTNKGPYHKYSISTLYKNNNKKNNILCCNDKKINISFRNKYNNFYNKSINDDNKANNNTNMKHFFTTEQDSLFQTLNNSKYMDNKHKKQYQKYKYFNNYQNKEKKEKEKTSNSYREANSKKK